jgi:class 3 adenylate cyclase
MDEDHPHILTGTKSGMTSRKRSTVATPPSGTVAFLSTDIEGSKGLWERQREAMTEAQARRDTQLRQCIGSHGGHIFRTGGDAFCATTRLSGRRGSRRRSLW